MKSKSLSALSNTSITTQEQNRTFDFVNLYKSASETGSSLSTIPQTSDASSHKVKSESPKRERSPNKRKKVAKRESIDVSLITIDGPELSNVASSTPRNEGKATSTPLIKRKLQDKASKVKSIMKTSTVIPGDSVDVSYADTSTSKSKKRNKSVSFNLGEEVASKKIKSDESTNESKSDTTEKTKAKRQFKKIKKNRLAEKENKIEVNQQTKENEDFVKEKPQKKLKTKVENPQITLVAPLTGETQNTQTENGVEIKKKRKNQKKLKKPDEGINVIGDQNATQEVTEKVKKAKKKKHQEKANEPENEEPASKSRKKDLKPDVVTELENLSIGDNAHTLSNMLDEMTVVDKEKRKKLKQQFKKNKKSKGSKVESTQDSDKTEDEKEKVKWSRRKWNKDGKADAKELNLDTTIIVENLPLSMLFSYKKVLAEHFVKYGLIKSVGIAEVYPTEVSKPVFTTTVMFYSDGAATLAMDDTSEFEGSRVKVRRPRPPTETTLVVRSYGPLTAQAVSSMFAGAGRLRNIRHLVKGKHAMSTYFVELDGPESVERGLKQAADAKAGGKKVYISRFEVRTKTPKQKAKDTDGSDADQSDDSQG